MPIKSLIICETSIIDARSNNISFINVFEDIYTYGFPAKIPLLTVVVTVERRSGREYKNKSIELRIYINRKELLSKSIELDFKGKKRTRINFVLNGLTIEESGILTFAVFYKNKEALRSSIEVKVPEIKK